MPPSDEEVASMGFPVPQEFRGLDPFEPLQVYTRNLPHWRQKGATYFVTFRQADSIPQDLWEALSAEAERWKERIEAATKGGKELPKSLQWEYDRFLSRYGNQLDHELDKCFGSCELRVQEARELVARAVKYFDKQRYEIYATVVMPNHCHVAIRPYAEQKLEDILHSWKSFTANRINEILGKSRAFWQAESYDRIVRDSSHFENVADYILRNPGKANLHDGEYWMQFGEQEWGTRQK